MNFWIFIIIITVLFILLLTRKGREKIVGICAAALGQDARKQENELEREGRVEQVGNTGRGVMYRLKP